MIKCHNTPGNNDSRFYEINLPYYGGGSPEEWLIWKDKLLKALDGQSISMGPSRYMFMESHLTDDAKAIFNQAALDIGIHSVDNFNKALAEMTKHAFPAYTFYKQKRNMRRHLVKHRSMKLRRLQELNAYLEEFPPNIEGQETATLSADEILDIIYHYMPTTWKNKMSEKVFNNANSTVKEITDCFEIRVENMEPEEDKKKLGAQG